MYVFLCEDSLDGIFTAIYDAWASPYGHKNIYILAKEPQNIELFCEYISVTSDSEKSRKVSDTIKRRCGSEVWFSLCEAVMADETYRKRDNRISTATTFSITKADALYRTLLYAFSMEHPDRILTFLGNPHVLYLFELSRSVHAEAHHLLGFARFRELKNKILFCKIHPKNYVLPILGDHFSDRLPEENFIIYDENRRLALVHRAKKCDFFITDASTINQEMLKNYSADEALYQQLWCGFFESITIDARKNSALQNQNIPKRFQKDTVEFRT